MIDLSQYLLSFSPLLMAPGTTDLSAIPWGDTFQILGDWPAMLGNLVRTPPKDRDRVTAIAAALNSQRLPRPSGTRFRGRRGVRAGSFLTLLRAPGSGVLNPSGHHAVDPDLANSAISVLLILSAFAPPAT